MNQEILSPSITEIIQSMKFRITDNCWLDLYLQLKSSLTADVQLAISSVLGHRTRTDNDNIEEVFLF